MEPAADRQEVTAGWAGRILDFWFKEVGEDGWWSHSEALDRSCGERFAALWREMRDKPADSFLGRADEALAAVILFDQIPRNMFRGTAGAFATDPLARDIARGALATGYDIQIGGAGRMFFYMPFQHSEEPQDQALSVKLFEALGDPVALDFARQHHAMIARFGRFPARNDALGREARPEEAEAIEASAGW